MDGTCAVRFTRHYDARPEEVWAALTEPESLSRWLAPTGDVELAPGGRFALAARVREVEPERRLELDWGDDRSVVRFELARDGDGTVLVLDHRRIAAGAGMRYAALWTRHLERLDSVVGP
jgi:uncharacterized protein YndB with AHSA1/START domain